MSYMLYFWDYDQGTKHHIPFADVVKKLNTVKYTSDLYGGTVPVVVSSSNVRDAVKGWMNRISCEELVHDKYGDFVHTIPILNGYLLEVRGDPYDPEQYNVIRVHRTWGKGTRICSSSPRFSLEMVI